MDFCTTTMNFVFDLDLKNLTRLYISSRYEHESQLTFTWFMLGSCISVDYWPVVGLKICDLF